jgi:hypothetical protein
MILLSPPVLFLSPVSERTFPELESIETNLFGGGCIRTGRMNETPLSDALEELHELMPLMKKNRMIS